MILASMKSLSDPAVVLKPSHSALRNHKRMAMEKNQCSKTFECAWTESSRTDRGVMPTPTTTQNQGGTTSES